MGLHFTLSPGWHVYWKNSGDAGFPPVVVFTEAPGLSKPELLWPAPHRFELPGDLVAFGYEKEVVYPIRATLKGGTGGGDSIRLEADVDYLVCEVDCVPYRYKIALDQPLGNPAPDPGTGPLVDAAWKQIPVTSRAGVSAKSGLDLADPAKPVLEVRLKGARPGGTGSSLFLESHDDFDTGKPVIQEDADGTVFRVPLRPREAGRMPATTQIAWTATGLVTGPGREGETFSLEASGKVGPRKASMSAASSPSPTGGSPRPWERPSVLIVLTGLSTILALGFWGLLGAGAPSPRVQALGFAAGAVTIGLLYVLSHRLQPERLAAVEMALLAISLIAWLRHRRLRRV